MRILVRTPNKIKKYRLWCNTVDRWMGPAMNKNDMSLFLQALEHEPHTQTEAHKRIERLDYDEDHKSWLEKFFDKRYSSLCYKDKQNGGE